MTTLATYSQHWSTNEHMSRSRQALQNHSAAVHSFNRAKRHGTWRRWRARLGGRSVQLQHYATGHLSQKQVPGGVQLPESGRYSSLAGQAARYASAGTSCFHTR